MGARLSTSRLGREYWNLPAEAAAFRKRFGTDDGGAARQRAGKPRAMQCAAGCLVDVAPRLAAEDRSALATIAWVHLS
jgi:hypothetical protein